MATPWATGPKPTRGKSSRAQRGGLLLPPVQPRGAGQQTTHARSTRARRGLGQLSLDGTQTSDAEPAGHGVRGNVPL
eukprot:11190719-Lingulodinium_polyedra.AAC.1